jgi:hypothetical protein
MTDNGDLNVKCLCMYREGFYSVDRCATGCEAYMNFADESACLMVGLLWNKGK